MRTRIRRPSAATTIALLALVVALSGTAIAALQSGDSLIARRTLSGNRLRLNTVAGKEVANLVWHRLTLVDGWQNYWGTERRPAWALDAQNVVHLRGAIWNGSAASFARLPISVRPHVILYPTTGLINAAPGRIVVDIDGWMHVQADGSFADAQGFTNLDGVTWAVR